MLTSNESTPGSKGNVKPESTLQVHQVLDAEWIEPNKRRQNRQSRIQALRRDYRDRADVIFGEPPNFDLLLEKLAVLEAELNS